VFGGRSVGKGLPVFELFVLVEEFDGDMAVGFLQDSRPPLVEGLDLVDDCGAQALVLFMPSAFIGNDFSSLAYMGTHQTQPKTLVV